MAAVTFLKASFADKYPEVVAELNPKIKGINMMEMFNQLLNFVDKTVPHSCLKCKSEYFPFTQDRSGSKVTCMKCELPAHGACIKDEAVNTEWGIVFLCDICILNQDKPVIPEETNKPPQSSESDTDSSAERKREKKKPQSSESGQDSDSSDEKRKVKKKRLSKTRKSPKPKRSESHTSADECDDSESESDKQKKMCAYFKQGTCRYGVSGRSGGICKFIHRKVCAPFRLYGEARNGCQNSGIPHCAMHH